MNKILFLCTGNSCRSQMAEGFARKVLGPRGFEIVSAGIEAHGLNPHAVSAMAEVGIDISRQQSRVLDAAMLEGVTRVVTVCGDADEQCPSLAAQVVKEHWPLPDPARFSGTEIEVAREFARVRDDIEARVNALADSLLMK